MIEYDFERVAEFWDRVYKLCEERDIKCVCGTFSEFVKIVEEVVVDMNKIKY